MTAAPNDVIHADRHGAVVIPPRGGPGNAAAFDEQEDIH
jgi:hypothetical protein